MPDPTTYETELSSSGGRVQRYPSPFFDLAQYYQPNTMKELFRWCTFFYYNSPLLGSTLRKISRYPITEPIFEDDNEHIRELWRRFFVDIFKLQEVSMDTNLNLNVYGNAFCSLSFPFTRFLICEHCRQRTDIKRVDWKWHNFSFAYMCPHCQQRTSADYQKGQVHDMPIKDPSRIKLINWNAENVIVKHCEATGETFYSYFLPQATKWQISNGDRDVLGSIPLIFIDAYRQQRLIRLSRENFFHLKAPTLAEKDFGYGKPAIVHVLKDIYYLFTLRRAQEAIAVEHITPFDLIYPASADGVSPFTGTDLGRWRTEMEKIIQMRRRDPNFKAICPLPIGTERLGGDGKALLITPELQYLNQTIVGGLGIPQDFLFGNLSWTGSSITLRSLSNDFKHNQTQILDLANWIKEKVRIFMGWPNLKRLRFQDFKMADDIQRIQQFITLNASNKLSDRTLLTEMGLDFDNEMKEIAQEVELRNQLQEKMMLGQARAQGETQIISYTYQRRVQLMQAQDGNATTGMPGQAQMPPAAAMPMLPEGQESTTQSAGNFGGPTSNPATAGEVSMEPMPTKQAPRRAGTA